MSTAERVRPSIPLDTGVVHDKEVRYGGFIAGAVEPKVFPGWNDAANYAKFATRYVIKASRCGGVDNPDAVA